MFTPSFQKTSLALVSKMELSPTFNNHEFSHFSIPTFYFSLPLSLFLSHSFLLNSFCFPASPSETQSAASASRAAGIIVMHHWAQPLGSLFYIPQMLKFVMVSFFCLHTSWSVSPTIKLEHQIHRDTLQPSIFSLDPSPELKTHNIT